MPNPDIKQVKEVITKGQKEFENIALEVSRGLKEAIAKMQKYTQEFQKYAKSLNKQIGAQLEVRHGKRRGLKEEQVQEERVTKRPR